jgi:hypothetical protein
MASQQIPHVLNIDGVPDSMILETIQKLHSKTKGADKGILEKSRYGSWGDWNPIAYIHHPERLTSIHLGRVKLGERHRKEMEVVNLVGTRKKIKLDRFEKIR